MVATNEKYETKVESRSRFETKMTLKIKNFQASDAGSYKCNAKNSVGDVESSIRIHGKLFYFLFNKKKKKIRNTFDKLRIKILLKMKKKKKLVKNVFSIYLLLFLSK